MSPLLVVWFASGIVMMYAQMPVVTGAERLARRAALDVEAVRFTPLAAAKAAKLDQAPSVSLAMFDGRPAYRFAGRSAPVFADDGTEFAGYTTDEALEVAEGWMHAGPDDATREVAADVRHAGMIEADAPDQWTVQGTYRALAPLHKIVFDDDDATVLYVSDQSGDVVLKTTRKSRFLAWLGAIPHWIYPRFLRTHRDFWYDVVVYTSLAATFVALAGLMVGLARWLPRPGSATSRRAPSVPYRGWMRWHHITGLLFGVATVTWAFSGLLSMGPWGWSASSAASGEQRRIVAGGVFDVAAYETPSKAALRCSPAPVIEVEFLQFRGRPYYLLVGDDGGSVLAGVGDGPHSCTGMLDMDELLGAAKAAMPNAQPIAVDVLEQHDAYYYSRSADRPLPALRVKFDDPQNSWLYFDPRRGRIAARYTTRARVNRWLYHGLHSFDLPWLHRKRPLWDIVVIAFMLGGLALSVTGTVVGWRHLKRTVSARRPQARARILKT